MKRGDPESTCHGRVPDAKPTGASQRDETVPVGAPKQAATECAKQVLGVARPRHRGAKNLRPKDRASRERSFQRTGCAIGKGKTPVKDGRRKAGCKGLSQERYGTAIQLEMRPPKHLAVWTQAPRVPLREADQQDVEASLQVWQEGRHEHVKTGRAFGLKVFRALKHQHRWWDSGRHQPVGQQLISNPPFAMAGMAGHILGDPLRRFRVQPRRCAEQRDKQGTRVTISDLEADPQDLGVTLLDDRGHLAEGQEVRGRC